MRQIGVIAVVLTATVSASWGQWLLYSPEGNRLRRFDIDTVGSSRLAEDIFVERASAGGRDINGQVCLIPDGSGRFIAGEDTGQPHPVAGWGIFDRDGNQVGKLTATYLEGFPEPFGCAFAPDGRLFTSNLGNQASGEFNGQLILWFPPYEGFPGPEGAYPDTDAHSTNFCKIAIDIGTAGTVATDEQGRVYIASAREPGVFRFSPPFPTSPDAAGGCGATDPTGAPMADEVHRELFISDPENVFTPTGIARAPNGNWYVSSVLNGVITEYDGNGNFVRRVLDPPPNPSGLPLPTGHPQGLAVDGDGNLYYADLALVIDSDGIGPGPNGTVRRISFDRDGNPSAPIIIKDGLSFPDGLGLLPGDLEISPCLGDCNGDGKVTVDELVTGVLIALGDLPPANCAAVDRDADGEVTVEEITAAARVAFGRCAAAR